MSRIPSRCQDCGGRNLVYATILGDMFKTRYRKCESCGVTSKAISVIPAEPLLSGRHFGTQRSGIVNNADISTKSLN